MSPEWRVLRRPRGKGALRSVTVRRARLVFRESESRSSGLRSRASHSAERFAVCARCLRVSRVVEGYRAMRSPAGVLTSRFQGALSASGVFASGL
eukprot:5924756-Alexandrium_andersonii.AAC.1